MIVERKNNELLVRFKLGKNASRVQSILDYLSYEELTSKSNATEEDVTRLVNEAKKGRWKKIKSEF
jgi:hypothetical protein